MRLSGDVGAWRRRLLIVRYEAPPPKRKIPDFGARLVREEGSGILNYFIAGLAMLLQDLDQSEDGDISVNEIVEAYAAFCPDMGWNPMPITEVQHSLEGLMLELFHVTKSHCVKRDNRSVRGFFGVSLNV